MPLTTKKDTITENPRKPIHSIHRYDVLMGHADFLKHNSPSTEEHTNCTANVSAAVHAVEKSRTPRSHFHFHMLNLSFPARIKPAPPAMEGKVLVTGLRRTSLDHLI